MSVMRRIMDKVVMLADCGCWAWVGAANGTTPVIGIGGRGGSTVNVRRLVFESEFGEIPDGMTVIVTCGLPLCVNPHHMKIDEIAYARQGNAVKAKRSRTHCPSGHAMEGHNLIIRKDGTRKCRACKNANKVMRTRMRRDGVI